MKHAIPVGDEDPQRAAFLDGLLKGKRPIGILPDDMRPREIGCWTWYDKANHEDLGLWQLCLRCTHMAGAKDLLGTATKMYLRLGGVIKAPRARRRRRGGARRRRRDEA